MTSTSPRPPRRPTPAPAILTTNGFGGSKDDQKKTAEFYASQGYVVLSYSGLGFGGSGCKITLDDRDYDGKAGKTARHLPRRRQGGRRRHQDRLRQARRQGLRRQGARLRSAARHGRRLLRRPDPVRDRRNRPARGHDRPVHHVERSVLLAGPEQHVLQLRASATRRRASRRSAGSRSSSASGRLRACKHADVDPSRLLGLCPNFDDRACAAKVADGRHRRAQRGDDRLRTARVRRVVHGQDPHPDDAGPGPGRHAVQPPGVRRDLPLARRRRARR